MKRLFFFLLLVPAAHAEETATEATAEPTATPSVEERLDRLERENESLRAAARKPAGSLALFGDARLRLTGYLDAGFFDAGGDGSSYVRDAGKTEHPELASFPWVFLGDPWASPINAQGDPADLGLDRTNINRFDPIRSGGRPSFLVNTINFGMVGTLRESLLFEGSLNFEPRQGTLGSSGDQLDVDLAYLEWIPRSDVDLHVFAGKFESTFGIEYRGRKAPDRFGITPSIISRYTMGSPTGLKVRGSVLSGSLIYNAALTNGGMFTEKFGHFVNEIDTNGGKTGSGRIAVKAPLPFFLEVGASAVAGAEDLQPKDDQIGWQYGADVKLATGDFVVRAEYLRGRDGDRVVDSPFLRVEGWYAEGTWQALPWAGLLVRGDYRHARLNTPPNLYVSDVGRATVGMRFDPSPNAIFKIEYVHVRELSGPELDDDVFTSSLIARF